MRTVHIVRAVRTPNSANSSKRANSANNEQCEQFVLCERCEQRTVRTVHIGRTVRTTNSANSSFFWNRRTRRTVRTGAKTDRWSLPYGIGSKTETNLWIAFFSSVQNYCLNFLKLWKLSLAFCDLRWKFPTRGFFDNQHSFSSYGHLYLSR